MQRRDFLIAASAAALAAALPARAFALNGDGLADIESKIEAAIARGELPGAVWLVAQGDDVQVGTAGAVDYDGGKPIARDTIFRIASVTKPITAVAVMILVEEGKVSLDEPVDRLLPELANRQVLTALNAPLDSTVPAKRPILVRDLLTNTLGMGIEFDPSLPIVRAIDENQLVFGEMIPDTPHAADEYMRRLGTLPLMYQPGERWAYNLGSILQGILIERTAGVPFADFLEARVFSPLGMKDTAFFVPANKLDRFVPQWSLNYETGERYLGDPADGQWASAPALPHGGGGLVSTVDDLLAFGRMLHGGGVHNGTRLLSEESVREMTADHLTPDQKAFGGLGVPDIFAAMGWGYGMSVTTAPLPWAPNPGRFGWDGGFGTSFAVDPATGLIGILLSNSPYYLTSNQFTDFWTGAFAAAEA